MRNPKWHRDEIILALDLYFKIDPGQIHARLYEFVFRSENNSQTIQNNFEGIYDHWNTY